ncbi:pyridoxal phosphate-dependent transferase [Paraphoma chrysanthemicola]|uniref:Pyridoxal phosphate-dependent transferase n=1 Tax=Paraphoma chrysanthemicola TaxID=798071 RepID=A0A8K0R7F1_9PLEO|nr:pyridoxal phosphate-dependent transferase [Paraphoma chrysanthemicola]
MIKPAKRVATQRQDVWSFVNEAAAKAPIQPIINMGQGFFGYNPPDFVIKAAKSVFDHVHCNQYAPTKGRPTLKAAIAKSYAASFGRAINPETEVVVTTGANEGMLSAFFTFLEPGDEVIVFEPFFDQYISNIQMPGAKVVVVKLHAPPMVAKHIVSSAEWTVNFDELKRAITKNTKMIVLNTPHNPLGKVFSAMELEQIGQICVENNLILLSDEVYDHLLYVDSVRPAALHREIAERTLTVGSAGKMFYATGWRVGWLIGPANLIKHVAAAHTRICYSSVSPLQEAVALSLNQADTNGFFDQAVVDMLSKVKRFTAVFDELSIPYTRPEGGYFVVANLKKIQFPDDYFFPPHVAARPRDFRLSYFLMNEVGVAAVPPSEFYLNEDAHLIEDCLRFSVCKTDEDLEEAKRRLRGLSQYIRAQ